MTALSSPHRRSYSRLAWLLVAFIAIFFMLYNAHLPYTADDLFYYAGFQAKYGRWSLYPRYVYDTVMFLNGRIANWGAVPLFALQPDWMVWVENGLMVAAFLALVFKASLMGRDSLTARIGFIFLFIFTYPWWDSMMMLVCQFNYTWAMVPGLALVLWLLDGIPRRMGWAACLLAAVAGLMHEAFSLPLLCGIAVYLILSGRLRSLSRTEKAVLVTFALATAFVCLCPGILRRFLRSSAGESEPLLRIILTNDFYAVGLLIFSVVMLWARPRLFRSAIKTPWVIFAVAAMVSAVLSVSAGWIGRSGWFAQTFALIAFFRWGMMHGVRIPRLAGGVFAAIASGLVIIHLCGVMCYQVKVGAERQAAFDAYRANPAEPVYMDWTPQADVPWYFSDKVIGMVDYDEGYDLATIRDILGDSIHEFTVLPAALRDIDASGITAVTRVQGGFLTPAPPVSYQDEDRTITLIRGRQYMVVPFVKEGRSLWYVTPRILDPDDRDIYLTD